jgi:hypothetical protein
MVVKVLIIVLYIMMLCVTSSGYQHFAVSHLEDGGDKVLRNAGNHLQSYMNSHMRKPQQTLYTIISRNASRHGRYMYSKSEGLYFKVTTYTNR